MLTETEEKDFFSNLDYCLKDKKSIKKALKTIIFNKYKNIHVLKFIIFLQKQNLYKKKTDKYLLENYNIFDISGLYIQKNKSYFTEKYLIEYEYDKILNSLENNIFDENYDVFCNNYEASFYFLENQNIEHQNSYKEKVVDFLKDLVKIGEFLNNKKINLKVLKIIKSGNLYFKEVLMFLMKEKLFLDSLKFRIYFYLGNEIFEDKICRVILENETKWKGWRDDGYPKEVELKESMSDDEDTIKIQENKIRKNTFLDFINSNILSEEANAESKMWYSKRKNIFKN